MTYAIRRISLNGEIEQRIVSRDGWKSLGLSSHMGYLLLTILEPQIGNICNIDTRLVRHWESIESHNPPIYLGGCKIGDTDYHIFQTIK